MIEIINAKKIKGINDLKVYNLAYDLAMQIFELSSKFPKEETYSLTDQIRRSSRSVAMNIREGFAKKRYEQVFIRQLNDSLGSSEETRGWLQIACDCRYLDRKIFVDLDHQYDGLNAMLYKLMQNWETRADEK
jgi:four helix bundle protein